jgi:hypothetical protein
LRKRIEAIVDQWSLTDEAIELAKPEPDPIKRREKIKAAYARGYLACYRTINTPEGQRGPGE